MENSDPKPSTPQNSSPQDKFKSWNMVNLAFDMGFVIALPLVAFGLLGKYLDGKFDTAPFLTLAGIVLAIVSTTIWLTKKLKSYINKA